VATGKEILRLPKGWYVLPPVAAFSPDSKSLALKVQGDAIYLLELPSGHERWKSKFSFVCSNRQDVLAFTADGRTLIVNPYDPVLYRYETATGRRLFQAGEEGGWFFDLAFAADGRSLYTL